MFNTDEERNRVQLKVQAVWVDSDLRTSSQSGTLSHHSVQDDSPVPCEVMTGSVRAERLAEAVGPGLLPTVHAQASALF